MSNNFEEIIKKKLNAFPIGAWVPYYNERLDAEWLKQMAECGINFIPTNTCGTAELDLIRKSGLKCIVSDDDIVYANVKSIRDIQTKLANYTDREEVMGVFVWDEPSPLMMRVCGAVNYEIQRVAPQLFGFINLHPSYSDQKEQRDGLTYEEYLEYFVKTADPKFICFDHYPFLKDKITSDYFYNLQAVRDCCNRHDLSFWSFIQTCCFCENVTPTENQMKWHVYTNLAYGAKGLLYFTYATVIHDPEPCFGPALVDLNGIPTPRYYAAQKIDSHIQTIGKKLLSLSHKGVMFFGYAQNNTIEGFAGLKEVNGGAALVGCFEGQKEERYLFLVNLSQTDTVQFELVFADNMGKKTQRICLGAGEGQLIQAGL